ncbi:hypothetical protein HHX47_DHR2000847 [Lentinula edodes]|nr:hypothetical protein HHX47_DHR2000847 [Lentinula edodes]
MTDWKTRCARRKQSQLDSIPREWLIEAPPANQMNVMQIPRDSALLSIRELEITETVDVEVILQKLASTEWSSVEVTTAFYKRAIIAQQLSYSRHEPRHRQTNCLTEIFVEKALQRAKELDDILQATGKVSGPLHGLPISLKGTLMVVVNAINTSHQNFRSVHDEGTRDDHGSLRIPSAFCGLYTLRPSYERLPYCGAVNALEGQESISSVLGPMANSMSGVKVFTKAIIDAKPWLKDPLAVRKDWSDKEYGLVYHGGGERLCFGIMWDNDGGEDYRVSCELSGEPLIQSMLPDEGAHETAIEEPYVKRLVGPPYHRNTYELWNLHKEKRELRKSHLDHWEATISRTGTGRPIDAIISPAVAYAAVPHGLNTDSFYTTLCNAMDYATSVFPVTFVDATLDHRHPPHEFYNHEDEAIYNLYNSGLFDGCPVGLQLIGRTQEEEAVIAMTEIVDRALRRFEKFHA